MSLPQSAHHTPPDSPRASTRSAKASPDRDPSRVIDSLVDAIRDLASDDNYKVIASVIKDAKGLRTENSRLAASHRDILEEYRRFRNELEDREGQLQQEKQALENSITQKDDAIKKLKGRNETLNAEIEKSKKRLDEESQKCLDLGEKMAVTDGIVKDLQETLDTRNRMLDELDQAKNRLDIELTETKEALEQKSKAIQALEAAKAEADDRLAAATNSFKEKDREIAESRQSAAAAEADLQKMSEDLDSKTREVERLAVETCSLAEGVAAANMQLADKSKETAAALEEQERVSKQLVEANNTIGTTRKELDDTSQSKTDLESDLAETRTKLEERQSEAASLFQQWQEASSKLEVKSKEAKHLHEIKAEVDKRLEWATAELNTQKEAVQSARGELQATKESLQLESEKASILFDDLVALRASAEEQDHEIGQLKIDVAKRNKGYQQAQLTIKHLQETIEGLERNLKTKSGKLDEIKRYQRELNNEPEDDYVEILDAIWVSILELVEKHFSQDLEDSVLRDPSCWNYLRSSEYLLKNAIRMPLPQSNTPAAKQMRIAAVLAVLSRALSRHVFRPVYLIENDDELATVLRSLEAINPQQEYHTRSTLLAVLPDQEKHNAARRVKLVVHEVSHLVQHLLSALQYDAFRAALQDSCELACRQWKKIQHAAMKIEPYFGPPFDDFDWQVLLLPEKFDVHGNGNSAGAFSGSTIGLDAGSGTIGGNARVQQELAPSTRDDASSVFADSVQTVVDPVDIMMVLWPSMCAVEGGELVSITQGLVMAKEQANVAFEEEGRRKMPPQPRRARTMSTSASRKSSPRPAALKAFLGGGKADGDGSVGNAAATGSGKDGIQATS